MHAVPVAAAAQSRQNRRQVSGEEQHWVVRRRGRHAPRSSAQTGGRQGGRRCERRAYLIDCCGVGLSLWFTYTSFSDGACRSRDRVVKSYSLDSVPSIGYCNLFGRHARARARKTKQKLQVEETGLFSALDVLASFCPSSFPLSLTHVSRRPRRNRSSTPLAPPAPPAPGTAASRRRPRGPWTPPPLPPPS